MENFFDDIEVPKDPEFEDDKNEDYSDYEEDYYYKNEEEIKLSKLFKKRIKRLSKYYYRKYNESDPKVNDLIVKYVAFSIKERCIDHKSIIERILIRLGKIEKKIHNTPHWKEFISLVHQ